MIARVTYALLFTALGPAYVEPTLQLFRQMVTAGASAIHR